MKGVYVIVVALLFVPLVSAYTFDSQTPSPNSVTLSINEQKSSGDIIAFDVFANSVENISGAAFDMDFNDSIIRWAGKFAHDPDGYDKGKFFSSSAFYAIGPQRYMNGTVDNDKLVVGVVDGPDNPQTGSGVIITVNFRILSPGDTPISFSNCNLILPDGNFSSTVWHGGTLHIESNQPEEQQQDDPPTVSLHTPEDNKIIHKSYTDITCTASDDYGLKSVSLYTDISGSWKAYITKNITGTNTMQTFSLSGLSSGTYRWNCEATDTKNHISFAQSDYIFTVDLPSDSSPLLISGNTSFCYNGSFEYFNITVHTDEKAICKYTTSPRIPYNAMLYTFKVTNSTIHTSKVHAPFGYEYKYYVKCMDVYGNTNTEDFVIDFCVGNISDDIVPPKITNLLSENPVSSSKSYTTISFSTNESAECRYSSDSNAPFSSMRPLDNTGFNNHTLTLYGLSEGTQYTYYIQCSDERGNLNEKKTVTFFVCYSQDENCDRVISLKEARKVISKWLNNEYDADMKKLMTTLEMWKQGHA